MRYDLTEEQREEARVWVSDCSWSDLESEEIDTLTDGQLVTGIQRSYSGGWEQFLSDTFTNR